MMKKFFISLIIFLFILSITAPFIFAYSFAEFPILSSGDRYDNDLIFFNPTNGRIEYITSNVPLQLFCFDDCYIIFDNCDSFKRYSYDDGVWYIVDKNNYDDVVIEINGFEVLCSNYNIDISDSYGDTVYSFSANSQIPSTNWQQLQLQEQQKVNSQIGDLKQANSQTYNVLLSIYSFLAFAITVTAGGFVIYILCKPIFYFLR